MHTLTNREKISLGETSCRDLCDRLPRSLKPAALHPHPPGAFPLRHPCPNHGTPLPRLPRTPETGLHPPRRNRLGIDALSISPPPVQPEVNPPGLQAHQISALL